MENYFIYLLSFTILFCAEICSTLHTLCAMKNNKHGVAFFGATSSALWCAKIVVTIDQPKTIITAFFGAYIGTLMAFYLEKKINKK
jgi:hypothetical protein